MRTFAVKYENVNRDNGFVNDFKLPSSCRKILGFMVLPEILSDNEFLGEQKTLGSVSLLLNNTLEAVLDRIPVIAVNEGNKLQGKVCNFKDAYALNYDYVINETLRIVYHNNDVCMSDVKLNLVLIFTYE